MTTKGVDIINRKYPPGVFFKGSQIFGQKNKGLKSLGENLRGPKSISKFDQIFYKISIFFLEDTDTDPNIWKFYTFLISKIVTTYAMFGSVSSKKIGSIEKNLVKLWNWFETPLIFS